MDLFHRGCTILRRFANDPPSSGLEASGCLASLSVGLLQTMFDLGMFSLPGEQFLEK